MIPILYSTSETSFTSNGLGRLTDCISCLVTEERNGIFECEFKYPITGKFYNEMVTNGGIISVTHDDAKDRQPFDIYKYSAPIDGIVTFNARHISYRLSGITVKPFTAASCALALQGIGTNSLSTNPFSFWTDKAVTSTFTLSVPTSAKAILAGQQGSILDVYGKGEYKFDKFDVKLYTNRGTNSGVTIRYGKNLSDTLVEKDNGEYYNAIVPYWKGEDGTLVTLTGWYVVQTGETLRYCVPVDFSSEFQSQPTELELRTKAAAYLANNTPWLPKENIKVDFVQLWNTDEYKNVAVLERVKLCDTVAIYYPALGLTNSSAKVIKVVYDTLLERYTSIELGEPQQTLAEAIMQPYAQAIASISDKASVSFMEEAIQAATDLITGGLGGHVVINRNANGEPEEILIMDTDDTSTAVNVWRWNLSGLAHSHSGYNGPFDDIAITQDGKINADIITAGTLNAMLVDIINLDADNITSGTLSADRISAGSLSISKLDSAAQNTITTAASNASTALSNAATAQSTANSANSQEQLIYISRASGTTTQSATTTWITDTTGNQNTWTIKRPTYNSSYPVLFVATQRKNVAGTVTCTTPQIDNTTTVIDGGHIITGTIDASVVNVSNINADNIKTGTLKAITIQDTGTTPKNYWDLSGGNFVATNGSIGGFTLSSSGLSYGSVRPEGSGIGFALQNGSIRFASDSAYRRYVTDITGSSISFGDNTNATPGVWNWKTDLVPGTTNVDGTSREYFGIRRKTPSSGYTASSDIVAFTDNGTNFYTRFNGDVKATGDLTVGGVLDVTQRRCYATLSQEGWYRVMKMSSNIGDWSFAVDFCVTRSYANTDNEVHTVKMLQTYGTAPTFVNEDSKSNNLSVTAIRYTVGSNGACFVDIRYNANSANTVAVDFTVHTAPSQQPYFTAEQLQSVGDSPSGETVLTKYTFAAITGMRVVHAQSSTSFGDAIATIKDIIGDNNITYGGNAANNLHAGISGFSSGVVSVSSEGGPIFFATLGKYSATYYAAELFTYNYPWRIRVRNLNGTYHAELYYPNY